MSRKPQPERTAKRARLDEELVARGILDTRSRARAYVMAGDVLVNGVRVSRAGQPVAATDDLQLARTRRFVSRGGDKLAGALDRFGIDPAGLVAADLGASTGGFTDCLIQRGVARVYAVDVGYGQIDDRLRRDDRVVVMERTNARLLGALPEPVDLIVIDVSFISLALIFPVCARLLALDGAVVPLIKPQFEAGPKDVGKNGVVRDPEVHRRVLREAIAAAQVSGFTVADLTASSLVGPAGNVEFLAHLVRGRAALAVVKVDAGTLVERAMASLPAPKSATDDGDLDTDGDRPVQATATATEAIGDDDA